MLDKSFKYYCNIQNQYCAISIQVDSKDPFYIDKKICMYQTQY